VGLQSRFEVSNTGDLPGWIASKIEQSTLKALKLISKFVPAALLMLLLAGPVMACMLPDTQLTAEESACCKKMAGQCADVGMDSSHSCCVKVLRPQDQLMAASHKSVQIHLESVALVAHPYLRSVASIWSSPLLALVHSPPGSPPSSTTILRI